MKTITILAGFDAYPDDRTPRTFVEGEVAGDLPDAFADMLVEKGLGRETSGATAPVKPSAAPAAETKD